MDLGNKIRRMRQQLNLTQGELADRCELTKGYISQLENDLTSPSIATLKDILNALGSDLSEFFAAEKQTKVVFTKEEFIEKQTESALMKWIIPNAQKNRIEPVLLELAPGGQSEEIIPHEGEEFGFVLEGKIKVCLGGRKYNAKKGESFYYTADKPHHLENTSKDKARVLWISTPPSF